MQARVEFSSFNSDPSLMSIMIDAKRIVEGIQFEEEDLGGGKFRSKLVRNLKSHHLHDNFLMFDEDTALIIQVSSPGGAYSKFLDVLLSKNAGEVKQCLFVTQTHNLAVKRNQIKNPGSDKDGHRIYFSFAEKTIGNYADSFLHLPIGLLGIELK